VLHQVEARVGHAQKVLVVAADDFLLLLLDLVCQLLHLPRSLVELLLRRLRVLFPQLGF